MNRNSEHVGSISALVFTVRRFREVSITKRWKDILVQLQQKREQLGDIVNTLSVLRDIELVAQELRDLQVHN